MIYKMSNLADWSIFLGIIIYIIAIIFSVIYYYRYKKISLIFLIFSIATYIFSVLYSWDVFEINRNQVMLMLITSTIIMIFLGKYLSKIKKNGDYII